MQTEMLEMALVSTLDRLDRARILEIAPMLSAGWTSATLAQVMMDKNDIIRDRENEEALLFFKYFFSIDVASRNEQTPRFSQVIGSLAAKHRYQSYSVGINYRPHAIPANIAVILHKDGGRDYCPIVAVCIGEERGPLKAALDAAFSASRDVSPPNLASQFGRSILHLWKEVLHAWIQAPG
jgi:hypothetical protein